MLDINKTAERIKEQTQNKGVPLKQLLSDCELGINTISKLANGTDILSRNLAKIADYLNCSVDYLLGRTDNPNTTYENYINGDNNGVQKMAGGTVTISNSNTPVELDSVSKELVETFQKLNFKDKAKVMSLIAELIEG